MTNALQLAHLPSVTVDISSDGVFSCDWQVEEIEWAKAHVKEHSLSSARGMDRVDYSTVLEIENDEICALFNDCMAHCDAPSVWFTTTVVGVPKQRKGEPSVNLEAYWTTGLESCFLKLLTLLVHK
jgi:hypothetical protein